ncbi:MAG: TraR/DksA family transcriptional regulator [Deltaproteobacteria bacterium]|nr:TraR/DksA family transcriptional regulator [Deltaproteobacteria bacterium]
MNDKDIEQFRQKLIQLKSELQALEESSKKTSETVELDQARTGRLTRMDAMQAQQMALEGARRRQQQLVKIDGAMRRMDSGDYGYCFICEEEIDIRRLDVDPTNTRCIECAQK